MEEYYNREELLQYPPSEVEAIELQEKWVRFIEQENAPSYDFDDIRRIAGVDLTYLTDDSEEYGISCAILWDVNKNQELSHAFAVEIVDFPYIRGLLAFREIRLAAKAIKNLSQIPDVILFDGHGKAHPRRFGAAVAIGVAMNIASVGIAKRPLIHVSDWKSIGGNARKKLPIIDRGELVGYVMILTEKVSPVFISAGYKMELDIAVNIALKTVKTHKQPECLFLAHDYLQRLKYTLLENYKINSK